MTLRKTCYVSKLAKIHRKTFKTVSKLWNKGHTGNKHLLIRPDDATKIQAAGSKLSGIKINSKINFNKLVEQIMEKVNKTVRQNYLLE